MGNNCVEAIGYSDGPEEVPRHFHRGTEFIYVLEGRMEVTVREKSWIAEKDSLIVLNHLDPHEIRTLEMPCRRYFLLLNSDHTGKMLTDLNLLFILRNEPSHILKLQESVREEAVWIFRRLLAEQEMEDGFSEEQVNQLLRELFILIFRLNNRPRLAELPPGAATVTRMQTYIDGHFAEDLKISALAEIFFMNKFYLSHLFRKTTGYTIKKYLTLTRLAHACHLLMTTSLKINEICFESGFNDVNSFIRSFRSIYGCTPLNYRKEANSKTKGGRNEERKQNRAHSASLDCENAK